MKKLKENKQYIIVGLIIFIILIIGFFASDNQNLSVSKKTTTKTTSTTTTKISDSKEEKEEKIITSITELDGYNAVYWDYNEIYEKYFTMTKEENLEGDSKYCNNYNTFNKKTFKLGSIYDFIKIENNKLYWKISNNWELDKIIKENITFLYIDKFEDDIYSFIILTDNNKLYELTVDENATFEFDYDNDRYSYTNESIEKIKYEQIKFEGKITDVKMQYIPVECDVHPIIYFEINKNIYTIYSNDLMEIENYFKEINYTINDLNNNCMPLPFYEQFIINFDGSLEYKYQNISIAYYIEVFEEHNDKNAYDIIIDKNNQLYYLYRTDEKLEDKKLENKNIKIKNIVIDNKNDNKYLPNIKITLEDNDVIEFN